MDGTDLSLQKTAELFVKFGGAVLGAVYLFGLTIANVHFARLGITDLNILRIRSLLTGGLALAPVFFAAAALFPLRSQIIGNTSAQHPWSLRQAIGILVWAVFVGAMLTSWHHWLTGKSHLLDSMIIVVSVWGYYLYLTFVRLSKTFSQWHKTVASGILGLAAYTGLFVTHIYPQTPAYLGGARPECAKFIVDAQGAVAVNAASIRVQAGNGMTDPVFIFYENDELLVVGATEAGKSNLQLPKRLVIGRISCLESSCKNVPPCVCYNRFRKAFLPICFGGVGSSDFHRSLCRFSATLLAVDVGSAPMNSAQQLRKPSLDASGGRMRLRTNEVCPIL